MYRNMEKAIIFDMDGTLFKTELILESALTRTLSRLDSDSIGYRENPIQKYNEIMGVPLEEVWRVLLVNPTTESINYANQIFQDSLIEDIKSGIGSLHDELKEALDYLLTRGFKLYIASNGDTDYLKAIYDTYDLGKYFTDFFSINEVTTSSKSDLVAYIIDKENIQIKYIVGDRLSDFQATKDNGVKSIGCKFYFSKIEELDTADHVIESLSQLKEIIE